MLCPFSSSSFIAALGALILPSELEGLGIGRLAGRDASPGVLGLGDARSPGVGELTLPGIPEYRTEALVGVLKVLACGIVGLDSLECGWDDEGMEGVPWPVYLR